jgi:subtilase family serine protease
MTSMVVRALLSGAVTLGFAAEFSTPSWAQSVALIGQAVDNGQRITLFGNTRPEAIQANDVGTVADNFAMPHMLLQLKRSSAQQQLEQLAADVSNPSSASYRRFLTMAQFAAAYSPNSQDVQTITGWLQSQGFQVNAVYPTANAIDFSGTAGQVRAAFGTPIHQLDVNGESHIANMNDPQIPAALDNAVVGPVALHNFQPKPALIQRGQSSPDITKSATAHDIVPGDLYTIYNWTPLFGLGITGKGQTIGLMSESDTPGSTASTLSTSDWTTFRNTFNLNALPFSGTATLTALHPNGCSHSVNAAEGEADVDVEYSSAAAPDADILLVSCDAGFPGGIIAALTGTLALPTPPGVISISYGECEAHLGSAANKTFDNLYLSAAVMGISVFVSSGDSLGYVCNGNKAKFSTLGLAVNGLASTRWNVAVGGTDFLDSYLNQVGNFWDATNRSTSNYLNWSSARSYVPELPWNSSCGSALIASVFGFATTYGVGGFCNNAPGNTTFLHTFPGTSAGTSTLYSVPLWQVPFVPIGTSYRLLNDVSLFSSGGVFNAIKDPAGNGVWGHAFRLCYSPDNCSSTPTDWPEFDGTSFASPIWAGIQTLVNQHAGGPQGLPTPAYYLLAGVSSLLAKPADCNSSRGGGPKVYCIFHDVTQGDDDAPCAAGSPNCYAPGGSMACFRPPRHHTSRPSKRGSAGIFPPGSALPTSSTWCLPGRIEWGEVGKPGRWDCGRRLSDDMMPATAWADARPGSRRRRATPRDR